MVARALAVLDDHQFLARIALRVVTIIGFFHLGVFFVAEVIDVGLELWELFGLGHVL